MGPVDTSVLAVFNDLLATAQKAAPTQVRISAIEPPKGSARPATLLILVDQILVALASPYAYSDYR